MRDQHKKLSLLHPATHWLWLHGEGSCVFQVLILHDWSEGVAAWQCWPAHLVIDTCQHHKGRLCSAMAAFPGGPCTAKAALFGRPCTGRDALSGGLLCQVGAVLGLFADVASRYHCRLLGLIVQAGPSWQSLLHLTGCLHCVCMPSQHALLGMGMHGQGCCI